MIKKNSVLMILILMILFLIYDNKTEAFKNNIQKLKNCTKLNPKSSPSWVLKEKKVTKIEKILIEIVKKINKKTNKSFFFTNIDNISQIPINKINKKFIVDFYIVETKEDYTIRLVVDFTINNINNDVVINSITRANALYYDSNYLDLNEKLPSRTCLLDKKDENTIIKGFNEIELPYSLYTGNKVKSKSKPSDYYNEFLPKLVENDVYYNNNDKNIFKSRDYYKKKSNANSLSSWDSFGINNKNNSNCSDTNNNFKREKAPLISSPKFNSSIMKNISDEKENSWLFEPTRVEIDHNF